LSKKCISTITGPKPIGPYSSAVQAGPFLFVSGQGSIDPQSGKLLPGDIKSETDRTLHNLQLVLEDSGSSLEDVVSVTVFLRDMSKFNTMNEIYRRYFPTNPPTRTCVGVSDLPGGLQIEVNAVAYTRTPSKSTDR
jgi:2-iminobutanoate/2-iminopropanoate deaminase